MSESFQIKSPPTLIPSTFLDTPFIIMGNMSLGIKHIIFGALSVLLSRRNHWKKICNSLMNKKLSSFPNKNLLLNLQKHKGEYTYCTMYIYTDCTCQYSDNEKTTEEEDDIIAILKFIWCCYKANSFTRCLLNHIFSEIGLFTLHSCFVSCS